MILLTFLETCASLIMTLMSVYAPIRGLSMSEFSKTNNKYFTFPGNETRSAGNLFPAATPATSQAQQLDPSPTSPVLTRQFFTVTPNIVTPTVAASYCLCVPPGSCQNPITPIPTDGSGQIDIRIVNNPTLIPPTIITPTPPFSCNFGLVVCCQAGTYQCGRRYPPPPGSQLAQLGQADFGEYPWQVALLTQAEMYLGSGALITARHVLTAAHRIFSITPGAFKVRVGEWDAASTNEPIPALDFAVARVTVHPNFNQNNLFNDVAIITLAAPVPLTSRSTVGTICLPTTPFVGQRCYVAGWGKNDFGPTGAYQAIQREVDVPLITNADCQAALRRTRLGLGFVLNDASFVCAGGEVGKDACTGDGGSPLVCQSNNIWYVVGLVAWGIGCATGGIPGVYVNVATYLAWIQTILAQT